MRLPSAQWTTLCLVGLLVSLPFVQCSSSRRTGCRTATATTAAPPQTSDTLSCWWNERDNASTVSTMRGGANKIKTMTSRQMETLRLLSGGVAGTIASCVTNPLEVIKTQLQQSKVSAATATGMAAASGTVRSTPPSSALGAAGHVASTLWRTHGWTGFFRGLPPTLVGIIPSRSVYFYAYQQCQTWLHPVCAAGSPPNALLAGLLAGMAGNTMTNPIWMIRTRMQLSVDASAGQVAYRNYGDVIGRIFKEQGVAGFYKGLTASYWGCTEGAVQFLLYEQCKTRLLARANAKAQQRGKRAAPITQLPKATYFWSAAFAKMVASILTYPHEVARTRMREQARLGVFKYKGMWQTMRVILAEEGRAGLYSGMGIHLVKVVPNSALMFLTYEIVKAWLGTFTVVEHEPNRAVAPSRTTIATQRRRTAPFQRHQTLKVQR